MKIRESIQWLGWRLSKAAKRADKSLKISQKDVYALESISDHYEKVSSDNYKKNELMFKMYLWHRIEMMKHYKEDILGVQSQKTIAKALCKPVESFLDRFTEFINENNIKALIEPVRESKKPYFTLSEKEKESGVLRLQKMLKENPDLFENAKWEKEDVKENLIAEFNQFIQICS